MLRFLVCFLITFAGHVAFSQDTDHLTKSVYFGGGSYYIDEIQIVEIQEFVKNIPNVENYSITVHSHTDNIGSAQYNDWLSEMRSTSAIQILKELAIDPEKIEIKDFGQHNPVYDNSTLQGRMKNRRVDIIFWPLTL